MFGRKRDKAHIASLEASLKNLCNDYNNEVNRLTCEHNATTAKLTRDLRELDQLIYQMSQSGNADQLRSAVARAWAITEPRMREESNRINELLIPEIVKTYANHSTQQPSTAPDQRRIAKS